MVGRCGKGMAFLEVGSYLILMQSLSDLTFGPIVNFCDW